MIYEFYVNFTKRSCDDVYNHKMFMVIETIWTIYKIRSVNTLVRHKPFNLYIPHVKGDICKLD